jgi:hypothetical protein
MPRVRILRPLPDAITLRNGTLLLDARPTVGAWTQFARKDIPDQWQDVTLWTAYDRAQLEQVGREGFEVPPGTAADRVMQALVALKVAVPIPDPPSRATGPLALSAYQMRKG